MKKTALHGVRDDGNFALLVRQIRDGCQHQIERQLEADGIRISFSQYLVVKILDKYGPQRPGDLARYLDHNAGAMTRLIDQLEAEGYVRREPHGQDRRALTIELMPAGKRLWRTISGYSERMQKLALRGLSAADRARLLELLTHVRDALEDVP